MRGPCLVGERKARGGPCSVCESRACDLRWDPQGRTARGQARRLTTAGVWSQGAEGPGSLYLCVSLAQPCCLMVSGGQVLSQRRLCTAGENGSARKAETTTVLPRASRRSPSDCSAARCPEPKGGQPQGDRGQGWPRTAAMAGRSPAMALGHDCDSGCQAGPWALGCQEWV